MTSTVIAGYVRTPFTFATKGPLNNTRPDDLAALTLQTLIERTGVNPELIEDVLMGCSYPEASQGSNIARIASMLAGLPFTTGGATLNRFCGSSMYTIQMAAGQIAIGAGDAFIAAGVESMSMVPQGGGNPSRNPRFTDDTSVKNNVPVQAYVTMGQTAENVAARFNISRAEQEEFALRSQQKAAQAQSEGRLEAEIVPVTTDDGTVVNKDMCLRPNSTLEGLAGLKPAFIENGTVTAGTSSPLTDGAVAVLVTTEEFAVKNNLEIMARIKSCAIAGVEPEIMGMGPVPATKKALARANLTINDIDVIEINEAFSSQALACMRELGIDESRANIDGGAIALGHPLGATGSRITAKAAQIMKRENAKYALATQCIGGGQGIATVLEAV